MSTKPIPEASLQSTEVSDEIEYRKRGCCFWIPCFRSKQHDDIVWEKIGMTEKEESSNWWGKGLKGLMKVREWSELVAGPKWKTFIRRFNKSNHKCRAGKFQYDPLSYAMNFDEGPGLNGELEDDRLFRTFSSRYAVFPGSSRSSSVDFGKDTPPSIAPLRRGD